MFAASDFHCSHRSASSRPERVMKLCCGMANIIIINRVPCCVQSTRYERGTWNFTCLNQSTDVYVVHEKKRQQRWVHYYRVHLNERRSECLFSLSTDVYGAVQSVQLWCRRYLYRNGVGFFLGGGKLFFLTLSRIFSAAKLKFDCTGFEPSRLSQLSRPDNWFSPCISHFLPVERNSTFVRSICFDLLSDHCRQKSKVRFLAIKVLSSFDTVSSWDWRRVHSVLFAVNPFIS